MAPFRGDVFIASTGGSAMPRLPLGGSARGQAALLAMILALALVVSSFSSFDLHAPATTSMPRAATAEVPALPLVFEPNHGQVDGQVDFVARSAAYTLFLTPAEAVVRLGGDAVVRMQLVGADPDSSAAGRDRRSGVVNYLKGANPEAWQTGVPTFGAVRYSNVYPGIDALYRSAGDSIEYDFIVAPGADPRSIALQFEGGHLSLDPAGDLLLDTPAGVLRQTKPFLYQEIDGAKRTVDGRFALQGDRVGFEIGAYDRSLPLVIDPRLEYGTYVGAPGFDITFGVAVDRAGSAYVAGHTSSSNFPTKGSVACAQPTPSPSPSPTVRPPSPTTSLQCDQKDHDAFIVKLNPAGSDLEWATYLGGDRFDQAWDIDIDGAGNAYVIGATESADDPATTAVEADFPSTSNAFDRDCGADGFCDAVVAAQGTPSIPFSDAFMAKLSADGSQLLYSTFLGGSDHDQEVQVSALPREMGIAVKGKKAYVSGSTASPDFPTTRDAFQRRCGADRERACDDGNRDAFLSVIETEKDGASSLMYSTYIGGSGSEEGKAVAVDRRGNAYVGGATLGFGRGGKETNNFPVKNAFQTEFGGGISDGFVVKINPLAARAKRSLIYATYVGGGGIDIGWDLAVHSPTKKGRRGKGKAYLVGFTDSGDDPATAAKDGYKPYFPTTTGAFQSTYQGAHIEPDGSNLFMGGDAFVTKLKPSGRALAYSSFLGGEWMDVAGGVAVDSRGRAYVTGYVTCDNQDPEGPPCEAAQFPVTADALFPVMNGDFIAPDIMNIPTDSFFTRITANGGRLLHSTFLPGNHFDRGFGIAVRERDADGVAIPPEAYMVGRTNSTDFPVTEGAFQTNHNGGGRDGYVTKISD